MDFGSVSFLSSKSYVYIYTYLRMYITKLIDIERSRTFLIPSVQQLPSSLSSFLSLFSLSLSFSIYLFLFDPWRGEGILAWGRERASQRTNRPLPPKMTTRDGEGTEREGKGRDCWIDKACNQNVNYIKMSQRLDQSSYDENHLPSSPLISSPASFTYIYIYTIQ